MPRGRENKRLAVATEVPTFKSEDEAREWYETHDISKILDRGEEVKGEYVGRPRPKKKLVSLRLEEETIENLKQIAEKKGLGYQTLSRVWLRERLAEELKKLA
ncbi:MAG: CopG family antitoxin [Dehalococcoidia bacterium]|nr:CopG family antitoxin [Dehalococcoidia bacterium]